MATLTNTKIKDTYDGLLKTNDNGVLGGTSKEITDGLGNGSGIYIGTNEQLGVGNIPTEKLDVVGKMKISDDIILAQTNGKLDYDNGNSNGALRFHSTSGNTERMRITSSGRLGIGTDSPNNIGHIKTSTNGEGLTLQINSITEGDYSQLSFLPSTSENSQSPIYIRGVRGSGISASYLTLNTNSTERIRITSEGDVGIGTSSPSAKFSVLEPTANSEYASMGSGGTVDRHLKFSGFVANGTNNVGHRLSARNAIALNVSDNDALYIDIDGNVGIGESTPLVPLHISKNTASGENIALILDNNNSTANSEVGLLFRSNVGSTNTDFQIATINTAANQAQLVFRSDGGSERLRVESGGAVVLQTSDSRLRGGDTAGRLVISNSTTTSYISLTGSTYTYADEMDFVTNSVLAMKIDSSGNVGINTSNAGAKMEINASGGGLGGFTSFKTKYGTSSVQSLSIGQVIAGNGAWIGMAQYRAGGFWQTEGTAAGLINFEADGVISFSTNSGLTANTDYNKTERMRISSDGSVLVGTTADDPISSSSIGWSFSGSDKILRGYQSDAPLIALSRGANGQVVIFNNGLTTVGNISITGSATAYNTSSDYRLKEDWQPMAGALDRVDSLKPVNFAWKSDGSRVDGFLAHELAEVLPEAVTGEKDATEEYEITPAVLDLEDNVIEEAVMGTRDVYQGIDQSKIVPLLVAAIQELKGLVQSQQAEIELLKN
jgi:hypothetical protein